MPQTKSDTYITTYQTRPRCSIVEDEVFAACATLLETVKRSLFADMRRGKLASDCKSCYIKRFGITARQFNAIRVQLEGKISSIKASQLRRRDSLRRQIDSIQRFLKKPLKKKAKRNLLVVHQKKRRLSCLTNRLHQLEKDIADGTVRMCFGSKKLFRNQFALAANGYDSFEGWKKDWTDARSNSFFLLGSKDETAGNQTATATLQEDGRISIRFRLPDALREKYGKYLIIKDIFFSYGQERIVEALKNHLRSPVAISYRLVRDKRSWRIFASLPNQKPTVVSKKELGVIGVDINANHVAVTETDRFGNPIQYVRFNLNAYGKSHGQTRALTRDVAKDIVDMALLAQKPIILEELSFDKKKDELRQSGGPKYARMLSSFAYNEVETCVCSSATRNGVEVGMINPAYTSIIGRSKFSKRYGLSTHGSAALCIGRRFLKYSERLPRHLDEVADGMGGFVTVSLPARNRDTHVWSSWRHVGKNLFVVRATRLRAAKKRSSKPGNLALCDAGKASGVAGEIPARGLTAEPLGCRAG